MNKWLDIFQDRKLVQSKHFSYVLNLLKACNGDTKMRLADTAHVLSLFTLSKFIMLLLVTSRLQLAVCTISFSLFSEKKLKLITTPSFTLKSWI